MAEDTADWSFWTDWYDGWLAGHRPNPALLEKIVTSDRVDWDDVTKANATIVEIWRNHGSALSKVRAPDTLPGPTRAALREQVAFLLKTSTATSLNTSALSEQIGMALDAWLNATGLNQLPEELAVFDQMKRTLGGIADTLDGTDPEDDKVAALELRVLELEAENKDLLVKLEAALKESSHHPVLLSFYKAFGTTVGVAGATAVIGGSNYLIAQYLGVDSIEALGKLLGRVEWAQRGWE